MDTMQESYPKKISHRKLIFIKEEDTVNLLRIFLNLYILETRKIGTYIDCY